MYKMLNITFLLTFSPHTKHLYQIYKIFVLDIQDLCKSIGYTSIYVFFYYFICFFISLETQFKYMYKRQIY